jgi:hypothetical protein
LPHSGQYSTGFFKKLKLWRKIDVGADCQEHTEELQKKLEEAYAIQEQLTKLEEKLKETMRRRKWRPLYLTRQWKRRQRSHTLKPSRNLLRSHNDQKLRGNTWKLPSVNKFKKSATTTFGKHRKLERS